jgi:hypothetical protein
MSIALTEVGKQELCYVMLRKPLSKLASRLVNHWEIKKCERRESNPQRNVCQTSQWLKSVVQGHFNYYAVPGNLDSLGIFRDRLIGSGGGHFVAAASNARSPGSVPLPWLTDSFLNRACSIHILPFALPPVIRDKNRMRQSAPSGSARGAVSDGCPYRDQVYAFLSPAWRTSRHCVTSKRRKASTITGL